MTPVTNDGVGQPSDGRGRSRKGTVFVVDRDASVRSSMEVLLRTLLVRVETYPSAEEFLRQAEVRPPACLVTDVTLPGMSGLDLQRQLNESQSPRLPVIFVVTHGDVPTAVQAVRLGALDFLEKPFVGRVLLRRVEGALKLSREGLVDCNSGIESV